MPNLFVSSSTVFDVFEVDNCHYPKSLQDLLEQPKNAKNGYGPIWKNFGSPGGQK